MKKTLLGLAVAGIFSTQAWATDILINSAGLNYSPDYKKITLDQPIVSLKQSHDSTQLENISIDKFVTFWDTTEEPDTFDKDQPNAILSFWDEKNDYVESTFIIHSAEKSGQNLVLNVEYLTNPSKNITPVSINNQPSKLTDLSPFTNGNVEVSATVLVDCGLWSGLDGRC